MGRELPVVAIDGPVGSGKTTVARLAAKRLGYVLVDTGALYRCLALAARHRGLSWEDGDKLGKLASSLRISFEEGDAGQKVLLDGDEVTREIREPDISQGASKVSVHKAVREALLNTQRDLGREGGVVMEGRDIGTVVFPDAEVKIFVAASAEIRAERRYNELIAMGEDVCLEETLREVKQRDQRDENRAVAPLKPATDAVILDTGPLSIEQVVNRVIDLVNDFLGARQPEP
jgi:CMP/dCMP kinase